LIRWVSHFTVPALMTAEEPSELAALLEGAYWTFLHLRLARRCAERGKVHGASFRGLVEMAHELAEAQGGTGALLAAMDELHRGRGSIEHEVLAGGDLLDVAHEWSNFVVHLTEFRAAR
jgi:hypothetical protein